MQAAFLYKWTNKATGMWYVASLQGHAPTRTGPHSEETKAKMSAKRKAYWAQKRAEKISNV